jgi:hypothetical protein
MAGNAVEDRGIHVLLLIQRWPKKMTVNSLQEIKCRLDQHNIYTNQSSYLCVFQVAGSYMVETTIKTTVISLSVSRRPLRLRLIFLISPTIKTVTSKYLFLVPMVRVVNLV